MYLAIQYQIVSKGRRRRGATALRFDALLFRALGVIALATAIVASIDRVEQMRIGSLRQQQISGGELVPSRDFAATRGYITYEVRGKGQRYWYDAIANRFGVRGGWRKIAKLTLGNSEFSKAVTDSQYQVEVGMRLKIPLEQ